MIVCPTCSSLNPDGATTCSTCGSPLAGGASTNRYPMALPPGTKLSGGAFSVGRVLGQGGFGITYKGNDINLARLVAVKELFPDGSRRQGLSVVPPHNVSEAEWKTTRDEFIEEARTVARFRHPGIVNVYFVWEENGTAYQAMEFLDGQSAGGLVEKGKLNEADALPIIERVSEALEVMHASGFIHRDLKPDNIVQTKDGRTVLIDFGTAKQFVREKTQKLNPVLTPGYAPLEQYSSQARFDHRLDVYALGATLYHLLTGEIPVSAVERAAGVELPSVRDKNPNVSTAVSDAIERAMAIKVGERFESASDFTKALRAPKSSPKPLPDVIPGPVAPPKMPVAPKKAHSHAKGSISLSLISHLSAFGIEFSEAATLSEANGFAIIEHMNTSPWLLFSPEWKEEARTVFNTIRSSANAPPEVPSPQTPSGNSESTNPYLEQIRGLYTELAKAPALPSFGGQARLDALERQLVSLSQLRPPALTACPSCSRNQIVKMSRENGRWCSFCHTEFSSQWHSGEEKFALVSTSDTELNAYSGIVLDWADWHRAGKGFPLKREESKLHQEADKLRAARDAFLAGQGGLSPQRVADINSQLDDLYRRSVIEGFVDLNFSSVDHLLLRKSHFEKIMWRCKATSYTSDYAGSFSSHNSEKKGEFVLSPSQFWFASGSMTPGYSFKSVQGVRMEGLASQPLLTLILLTRSPLRFAIASTEVDVRVDEHTRCLRFDVYDVEAMIKRLL